MTNNFVHNGNSKFSKSINDLRQKKMFFHQLIVSFFFIRPIFLFSDNWNFLVFGIFLLFFIYRGAPKYDKFFTQYLLLFFYVFIYASQPLISDKHTALKHTQGTHPPFVAIPFLATFISTILQFIIMAKICFISFLVKFKFSPLDDQLCCCRLFFIQ